ncbi:MAG TPA: alpha/beta fold hydrolase [Vicinamibacterales bacterium]|nr:alpha/beta fold hydrolase [Vicinamibacterales bacterium]
MSSPTVSADPPVIVDPGAPAVPPFAPRPFRPRRGLSNGHVMTLVAWARRRDFPELPAPEARLFDVAPDTRVLAHCYWQADRAAAPTLLGLHGLEGSSSVHYMRGLADKAWRRGWNAVLLNQRNCGGTEHLSPGLYHSGLTDDPRAVIRALAATDGLTRFGVVGYSLGGNLTVKLAGELADHPDIAVRGVVAICPTIDLDRCVREIERRSNIAYHFNFVRNLKKRMRRKAERHPDLFDLSELDRVWTIRRFDDVYTAPHHGFGDAARYYHRASAIRVADRIRVPTLILAAADDPVVPAGQFADPALAGNPYVRVEVTPHGGHCGFLAPPSREDDGYWAETTALDFLSTVISA